jgi:hypothetical protein
MVVPIASFVKLEGGEGDLFLVLHQEKHKYGHGGDSEKVALKSGSNYTRSSENGDA